MPPEIPTPDKITSLAEFHRWIAALSSLCRDGILKQYFPIFKRREAPTYSVEEIKPDGPLPDMVEMYFETPSGNEKFIFSVGIYRGGGGEWRYVDASEHELGRNEPLRPASS